MYVGEREEAKMNTENGNGYVPRYVGKVERRIQCRYCVSEREMNIV